MDAFTQLCVELLSPLGPVRARAMFGGQGLYIDGLFAALIAGGELYLKVDDTTQARFEAAGCQPFTFEMKNGQQTSMRYYRPPEEAMESPPLMLPWARMAFEAALRAANAKVKKAAGKRPAAKKTSATAVAKQAAKPATRQSAAKKPTAKKTAAGGG